jgi:hypothetical protein
MASLSADCEPPRVTGTVLVGFLFNQSGNCVTLAPSPDLLVFGRRDIAEGAVEAVGVEPGDVFDDRELKPLAATLTP